LEDWVSARWTEQELAEYCNVHRRALRSNPLSRSLIERGLELGFIKPDVEVERPVGYDYKAQFEQVLSYVGIEVQHEFRFAPPRRWRSDYRVKGSKVLIEFEGGLFAKGKQGHSSISGILRDIEKYNSAALLGYIVIRITPKHVETGQALQWVEQAISSQSQNTSLE
jgi:hypothetical protein